MQKRVLTKEDTVLFSPSSLAEKSEIDEKGQKVYQLMYNSIHLWSIRHPERKNDAFADDVVWHQGSLEMKGIDMLIASAHTIHDALDDFHLVIDDIMYKGTVEDGTATVRWTGGGVFNRPLFGVEPTGKQEFLKGIDFSIMKNGKIKEEYFATFEGTPGLSAAINNSVREMLGEKN